ncbi:MAG: hypothetical protein ACFCVD_23775 [Nodosilinea sp.]
MGLSETLQDEAIKANLVADCTRLLDEQVAAKGGLSGMALKATYGVVKGIDASYISGAIERILPDVLTALNPMWEEGLKAGNPVEHLAQNQALTADRVLSVTDARVEKTTNGVVRSSYNKLRKSVKGDVEAAMPDLAKVLGTHMAVTH